MVWQADAGFAAGPARIASLILLGFFDSKPQIRSDSETAKLIRSIPPHELVRVGENHSLSAWPEVKARSQFWGSLSFNIVMIFLDENGFCHLPLRKKYWKAPMRLGLMQ